MRPEAELLMKAIALFEGYSREAQTSAGYHIGRLYGGEIFTALEAEIEARRASDRDRQQRRRSRDTSREEVSRDMPLPGTASPTPSVVSASGSSSLSEEVVSKSKAVLDADDFEFLSACPDVFKKAWLGAPDWWISMRDGYPKVNARREASKCMAYIEGRFKPGQIARLNLRERLRNWLAKADRWREQDELRKAVRR